MRVKRIITAILVIPIALMLIAFIIANREMMNVRLNPFADEGTGWSMNAPAFVFFFAFLGLGVVVGSIATWAGQHKYRKKLRRMESALDEIKP